jgi:hypothetical protein
VSKLWRCCVEFDTYLRSRSLGLLFFGLRRLDSDSNNTSKMSMRGRWLQVRKQPVMYDLRFAKHTTCTIMYINNKSM